MAGAVQAAVIPGNAKRGEQLFENQRCNQCHSFKGRGGTRAPDLAKRVDRDYSPSVMASLMWNHAPEMWSAMKAQSIERPQLSPEMASDLFAYFVSARYFERRGDAARGKMAFSVKNCSSCHGITATSPTGAPPVTQWESLSEPIVLAQQMWNHGARMREAYAQKKLAWSPLTAQELTDILVYLQNLPETRGMETKFEFGASEPGEKVFQSKGCAGCHTGSMALETRLRNQTLTQIAVDMWNHQSSMKQPPPQLTQEEMRELLSYLWAHQYFRGDGNPDRGKKVFSEKSCATCHNDPSSGAPKLGKGKDAYSDITMVSALWDHGPRMLEMMNQKKLAWPRFTAQQMSDLIAYLNSL
jgi:mono/diheme cytochrome c family protein